jgi:hypothetical protein
VRISDLKKRYQSYFSVANECRTHLLLPYLSI